MIQQNTLQERRIAYLAPSLEVLYPDYPDMLCTSDVTQIPGAGAGQMDENNWF